MYYAALYFGLWICCIYRFFMPVSPSTQNISTSSTPLFLRSLILQAKTLMIRYHLSKSPKYLTSFYCDTNNNIGCSVYYPSFIPYFIVNCIDKDKCVYRLQWSLLPFLISGAILSVILLTISVDKLKP